MSYLSTLQQVIGGSFYCFAALIRRRRRRSSYKLIFLPTENCKSGSSSSSFLPLRPTRSCSSSGDIAYLLPYCDLSPSTAAPQPAYVVVATIAKIAVPNYHSFMQMLNLLFQRIGSQNKPFLPIFSDETNCQNKICLL